MTTIAIDRLLGLVGIPFVEGGRSAAGIDCLGLALAGLQALGIPAEDPWDTLRERWLSGWRESESAMPTGWSRLWRSDVRELHPGDLLFVATKGVAGHVDLYVGDGLCLHIRRHTRSMLLPYERIAPRVMSAWRWHGAAP